MRFSLFRAVQKYGLNAMEKTEFLVTPLDTLHPGLNLPFGINRQPV